MSKTVFCVLTIVTIVHVFNCERYDDYYEDYPQQEPHLDYHELGPANYAALTAANEAVKKAEPKARAKGGKGGGEEGEEEVDINQRGMIGNAVGKATGIVSTGKCIITCITKNFKNCAGLIQCGWNCFMPQEKIKVDPKGSKDDKDIKVEEPKTRDNRPNTKEDPEPDTVRPSDIVKVFICSVKCLGRYLPRSKATLQSFMTCVVARCFCADKNA